MPSTLPNKLLLYTFITKYILQVYVMHLYCMPQGFDLQIMAFGFFCLEYLRCVQSFPVFYLIPASDFALGTVVLAIFLVFVAAVVVSVVAAVFAFAVVVSVTAFGNIAAAILPALVPMHHIYPLNLCHSLCIFVVVKKSFSQQS